MLFEHFPSHGIQLLLNSVDHTEADIVLPQEFTHRVQDWVPCDWTCLNTLHTVLTCWHAIFTSLGLKHPHSRRTAMGGRLWYSGF